jgi:hypothetical protein
MDRAFSPARRAIELDDSLGEGHTALANALAADLQFAAAEVEFKRAFVRVDAATGAVALQF